MWKENWYPTPRGVVAKTVKCCEAYLGSWLVYGPHPTPQVEGGHHAHDKHTAPLTLNTVRSTLHRASIEHHRKSQKTY